MREAHGTHAVVGLLELPCVDLDVVRLLRWRAIQIYETQKEQRLHDTITRRTTRHDATHTSEDGHKAHDKLSQTEALRCAHTTKRAARGKAKTIQLKKEMTSAISGKSRPTCRNRIRLGLVPVVKISATHQLSTIRDWPGSF